MGPPSQGSRWPILFLCISVERLLSAGQTVIERPLCARCSISKFRTLTLYKNKASILVHYLLQYNP